MDTLGQVALHVKSQVESLTIKDIHVLIRILHYYSRTLRREGKELCVFNIRQDVLTFGIWHHVVVKFAVLYLMAEVKDFELTLSRFLLICSHLIIDSCHILRSVLHTHWLWHVWSTELISHVGNHLCSHVHCRILERGRWHTHVLLMLWHPARGVWVRNSHWVLHVDRLKLLQGLDLTTKLINTLFKWGLGSIWVARKQVRRGFVIASFSTR